MASLPGWRAIPGDPARRYRNVRTGRVISRRERDNRILRRYGFRNRYELERLRQTRTYRRWGADIVQQQGHVHVPLEDWGDIHEVITRRRRLARAHPDVRAGGNLDAYDPELTAADGPLARLLAATGRRPLSNRPVGAT